jgi:molecular chaperone GrpE
MIDETNNKDDGAPDETPDAEKFDAAEEAVEPIAPANENFAGPEAVLEADFEQEIADETAETDTALVDLEAELLEVKDQMLRAVAEAENIRKRAQKQTEDAHKYANANFAKSLLSVADNLGRAIGSVPEEAVAGHELLTTLLDGLGAVERELHAAFTQHGIEKIEPIDAVFDPNFHEAMFEMEAPGKAAGTIVQVIEPGYVINDRLLRAARVGIAKASASTAPNAAPEISPDIQDTDTDG